MNAEVLENTAGELTGEDAEVSEDPYAGIICFHQIGYRLGFADSDQCHLRPVSPGLITGRLYIPLYDIKILSDHPFSSFLVFRSVSFTKSLSFTPSPSSTI